jgi:hypothetical protein
MTTVDPIASMLIGITVFDEPFRSGFLYLVGETLGLLLILAAAVSFTRSDPTSSHAQLQLSPCRTSCPEISDERESERDRCRHPPPWTPAARC